MPLTPRPFISLRSPEGPPGMHGMLDDLDLDGIERGADRVLSEIGVRFQGDPETLEVLGSIGGLVAGETVRLDGMVLRRIIRERAPRSFVLRGRNPDRDTVIGGCDRPVIAPMYGAPDVLLDDGRRMRGTRDAYRRLVELAHGFPGVANTGQMLCVMDDVPEETRPLQMLNLHLECSDKPFMGNIGSPEATEEVIALTSAAVGRKPRGGQCNLLHLINASPPLTYWPNPLKCLRVVALAGEASMVTSYMMMGASSPVAVAGSLIQGYAEVLAGLALTQLWRPGAPVVMGILGYPFDMKSMLPNFGDPASQLVQHGATQLARRLGVPARGDGPVTSSKVDDAQAGWEGGQAMAASIASGADFILHGAGWLEQGRCMSFSKFSRDARDAGEAGSHSLHRCAPPVPLDDTVSREIAARLAALDRSGRS